MDPVLRRGLCGIPTSIVRIPQLPCKSPHHLRLLEFSRLVPSNDETFECRRPPRLLAKSLRAGNRDLLPTSCLRNLDEIADKLTVLRFRTQLTTMVVEGR
jgi:hypothetical protein